MNLFVLGLRRSGTTIVHDALSEDRELRCYYEPLREEAETVGGGSGARAIDAFAETRAERRRFRDRRYPDLPIELFNCGAPRAPAVELEAELSPHCRELLLHLLSRAPSVAIKETRLHHKVAALAELDPGAALAHVVRDPRAVSASMLLGRRRRTDIYPDPATFFTVRTGRRLWSSGPISRELLELGASPALPADLPDFLRPLVVWKAAFAATNADGLRCFGDRYVLVRLEDLRADPPGELERIYGSIDRSPPDAVLAWARANIRRQTIIHFARDPRWARGARLLEMQEQLRQAGYSQILELEPGGEQPLDLTPPAPRSRLFGLVGRARRRLTER